MFVVVLNPDHNRIPLCILVVLVNYLVVLVNYLVVLVVLVLMIMRLYVGPYDHEEDLVLKEKEVMVVILSHLKHQYSNHLNRLDYTKY